jgi:NAD(P)-dependent dehydrogenase (short-subunit alcohol dehydrogenase family)
MVDELLDRGAAKVYATSRAAQHDNDPRIVALVLDVSDDASVAAAADAAPDVSIVVNNAGTLLRTPVLDAPLDEIRSELETNLFGTIRVARACAPILARHPSSSLVNVVSVLSWLALGTATRSPKRPCGQRRTRCASDCANKAPPWLPSTAATWTPT